MSNEDKEFYQRVDKHIDLSNDQIKGGVGRGMASASMMYATARFNAWLTACSWQNSAELTESREQSIDYFLAEYRKMLEANFDDYIANFDTYMGKPQDAE